MEERRPRRPNPALTEKGVLCIWKCLIATSSLLRPEVGNLTKIHSPKILHNFFD